MTIFKDLASIQSRLKAPKGQTNNFGKYKYRSCEDILEAVKPLLAELGCVILITDAIEMIGDRHYVKSTATLTGSEGEPISVSGYAREPLVKKGMDEAQITGATSSYARKYALNGLLLIDDTKDADACKPEQVQGTKRDTRKITPKQLGEIETSINDANADLTKFLSHFSLDVLGDMKRYQVAGAIRLLNKKIDEATSGAPS